MKKQIFSIQHNMYPYTFYGKDGLDTKTKT